MSTRPTGNLPARLEEVRRRLERSRRTRKPRSRIPDSLWAAAVKIASSYGVNRTAKVLRLEHYSLKKRVEQISAAAPGVPERSDGTTFLELAPPVQTGSGECTLELEDAGDGLAQVCKDVLKHDPFGGWVFLFRNRPATALKVLVYDGQGFWPCHKRLSSGRFRWWPTRGTAAAKTLAAHLFCWPARGVEVFIGRCCCYPDANETADLVGDKNITIARLRKMLFGASTEKTAAVIGGKKDSATSGKGHGRKGADAYSGAEKIEAPHESLQPGDPCPQCEEGTVYQTARPGVLVRLLGQAPLQAMLYYLQKLRCNLCGMVFSKAERIEPAFDELIRQAARPCRNSTSGLGDSSRIGWWSRIHRSAEQFRRCSKTGESRRFSCVCPARRSTIMSANAR